MRSIPPHAGQLRRWHTSNIDRDRAGHMFLILGVDPFVVLSESEVLLDMEYFLVLIGGHKRSFSRSLIEGWSDAISEPG